MLASPETDVHDGASNALALCVPQSWQLMSDSVHRVRSDLGPLFLYEAFLYYNPLFMIVSEHSHSLTCFCTMRV